MRKRICYLFVVLLLCAASVSAEKEVYHFKPFEAENLNGEGPLTEAVFEDAAYTFVNFWATWCPPCREELPALAVIETETGGEVRVIGVLMDAIDQLSGQRDEGAISAMRALLDDANADFPVLFPESDIILAYMSAIQAVPTTLVMDRDGVLMDVRVGSLTEEQWLAYARSLPGVQRDD